MTFNASATLWQDLRAAPVLSSLELCKMAASQEMIQTIPTLVLLQLLKLADIDMGEDILKLSPAMTMLERVELQMVIMSSTAWRELFHSAGQLRQSITVKLSEITMSAMKWRELMLSVCSLSNPIKVELDMCTGPSDEEWMTIEHIIKSTPISALTLVRTSINLPEEILRMDTADIEAYKKLLAEGEEKVYNIRVMIVGHFGVGKTFLTKRLMNQHQDVDILTRIPTEGIDVHVGKMKVDLKDENWIQQTSDDGNKFFERKAKVVPPITEGDDIPDSSKEISAAEVKSMPKPPIEFQKTSDDAGGVSDRKRELDSKQSTTNKEDNDDEEGGDENDDGEEDEEDDEEEYGDESLQESSESGGIEEIETNIQTNVSIENQNDDNSRETEMKIRKEISEVRKVTKDEQSAYLSIWDFAGQYAFYDTHQVFMSWRTIYLLVIDLSKEHNEVVEEDNCYVDCMGSKQWTVSEFAEFWLNAIHKCSALDERRNESFAGKPDFDETDKRSQSPPVILVGTFADKLQDKNVGDKRLEALRESLKTTTCKDSNLVTEYFVIDNKYQTDDLNNLRKTIVEVAKKQKYWGESKPARWIDMEIQLRDLKQGGTKILDKRVLLENMIQQNGPITTEDELNFFLKFHHETGNLIYFSEDEGLNETIVLEPQWLINAFKRLNPQREFFTNEHEIFKKWKDFDKYGILPKPLIETMWKEDPQDKSASGGIKNRNTSQFFEHKDHILDYLEKLKLLAKPHKDTFNISNINEFYFAPSFVKQKVQDKDLIPMENKITTSKLCFVAKSGNIPGAVFNKLLATCIAAYPLKCVDTKTYLLFCGCGIFTLNDEHELYLLFNENAIQIWLSREAKTPESSVCIKMKKFFESKIPKKDFELVFKLPQTSFIRMDGGFKLKKSDVGNAQHDFITQVTVIPEQLTNIWFPEDKSTAGNSDDNKSECLKRPHWNCQYNGRLVQLKPDEQNKIAKHCGGNTVFGALRKIQDLKSEGFALEVAIRRIHVVDEKTKEYVRQKMYASRFRHPFIVPTYAIFEKDKVFYFVSPYCENRNLKSRLSRTCCIQGCCDNATATNTAAVMLQQSCSHSTKTRCGCKLNEAQRIRIAFQVASAIHYLHTPRINDPNRASTKAVTVHGSITSNNIVLDRKLNARLIDFKNSFEIDVEMTETSAQDTPCGTNEQNVNQLNTVKRANSGNRDITTDYDSFDQVIAELMDGSFTELEEITNSMVDIRKDIQEKVKTADDFKTKVVDKLQELFYTFRRSDLMVKDDTNKCDVCMINQADKKYFKNHLLLCGQHMGICSACNYNSHSISQMCYSCGVGVKPFLGEHWGALLVAGDGSEKDKTEAETFQKDVDEIKKVIESGSLPITKEKVETIISDGTEFLPKLRESIAKFEDKCLSTMLIYFSCHGEHTMSKTVQQTGESNRTCDSNQTIDNALSDGLQEKHRFLIGSNGITLNSLTEELETMEHVCHYSR